VTKKSASKSRFSSVPSVMASIKLKCRLDLCSASGVRPARVIRPIRPIRHGSDFSSMLLDASRSLNRRLVVARRLFYR
jgi:hypothetical protein